MQNPQLEKGLHYFRRNIFKGLQTTWLSVMIAQTIQEQRTPLYCNFSFHNYRNHLELETTELSRPQGTGTGDNPKLLWVWPMATFTGKLKENKTKISSFMCCLIPHLLNVYTWKLEILVISLQLLLRHPSNCKNYTIHFHFLRYTCIYPIHLNSQVKGEAENSLKGLLYLENSFALLCFKATSKFPQHVFYSRDLSAHHKICFVANINWQQAISSNIYPWNIQK